MTRQSPGSGQGPERVGLADHGKEFRISLSVIGSHQRIWQAGRPVRTE